jgi:hypothetical protein
MQIMQAPEAQHMIANMRAPMDSLVYCHGTAEGYTHSYICLAQQPLTSV